MTAKGIRNSLLMLALAASVASSAAGARAARDPTAEFPARPESEATAEALAEAVRGDWTGVKNTGSMLPVLSASDLVVTRPVDIRELRVGDIIVFVVPVATLPDGQPVQHRRIVHRVVQRLDCERRRGFPDGLACRRVRTQGDNVRTPDRYATVQSTLEGRVAYVVDGMTGVVRDMRGSRKGTPITAADALRRELGPRRYSAPSLTDSARALAGP